MSGLNLSKQLSAMTKGYCFEQDTEGMSPAHVYKLVGRHENLYLKISAPSYRGTTYDVTREGEVLLWLHGKLPVPEVLHCEQNQGSSFLLMREVGGITGSKDFEQRRDPIRLIQFYAQGIKLIQSIGTANCPFDCGLENRLRELDFLLRHDLADIDRENWQDDTPHVTPQELYVFLQNHKPVEELIFSHGDFCDSNFFLKEDQISGFIDLGRAGKADRWMDIAFCVRSIQNDLGKRQDYLELFFNLLEIEPNWDKIRYYILLDELF